MNLKALLVFFLIVCTSSQLLGQVGKIDTASQSNIIPIEYRGHIFVEGRVKNVTGNWVFDTGADRLYFDSLFYKSGGFNYEPIASGILPGVGRKPQLVKIIMSDVEFEFHGFNYKTKMVPILSLKTIVGDYADGILGRNFFSQKALEINYKEKYMKVHDKIDSSEVTQYTKIHCQNINNRLYIPVTLTINDTSSFTENFTLDLGSGNTIALTDPIALKYNLKDEISNKVRYYTRYGGVGGESEEYRFIAKSIDIGGHKLNQFEVSYSLDKSGALSSTNHAGLLGNKVLERFDLIIDFATSCVYLKPNDSFSDPFKYSRLGFKYVDRSKTLGGLIVTGFFENSQAEKSGLLIDDKIIEINGISVKEMDYHKLTNHINENNMLKLKIERGTELLNIEIIQFQILRYE